MKQGLAALTLLIALAGCGGGQAADSAPACPDVAEHMLALANRDNQGVADPELADGIRAEFARQCRDASWSAERRRCLAGAREQDETLRCPER